MQRINTGADAFATGEAEFDVGDGLRARIPLGKQRYTIDETAGRVIKAWDYINARDQMIFGDTGRRSIEATWDPGSTGQRNATIRRILNSVQLSIYGIVSTGTQTAITLPVGFRPDYHQTFGNAIYGATGTGNRIVAVNDGQVWQVGAKAGDTIFFTVTWQTNDPWPSTLPGVAAGGIPT